MPDNDIAVKEDAKVGRPCKYESHVKPFLNDILEWLKQGMNEYSICDKLDISKQSWIEYKEKYIELANLFTRATHERNRLVMNKMYQRATGEKVTLNKQKLDKYGDTHDLIEEMYIPPDVNAADLFLRNNDPEYKSAKSVEITNNTTNNFQLDDWEAKRKQILDEIKRLELAEAVDVEAIPCD